MVHIGGNQRKNRIWERVASYAQGELSGTKSLTGLKLTWKTVSGYPSLIDEKFQSAGRVINTYTRSLTPIKLTKPFSFRMYRQSAFPHLSRGEDIDRVYIGDELLDDRFVFRSPNPELLQYIFRSVKIREMVLRLDGFRMALKKDEGTYGKKYPKDISLLYIHLPQEVKSEEALYLVMDLTEAMILELEGLGLVEG